MGVPLFLGGRVIGVLGLFDDSQRRTFDDADVEVAQVFAAAATIAIHNAQLYERAQQEIAERQRAEDALREANELLEDRVEARTKELAATNVELAREVQERIEAEKALRATEAISASVLASFSAHLAIVDRCGKIIRVNEAWDRFAGENGVPAAAGVFVGADYVEACRTAAGEGDESAAAALGGIRAILAGQTSEFLMEYPCHAPGRERWFVMRVVPMRWPEGGAVVSHVDVTPRKKAEVEIARLRWELAHVARVNSMGEIAASLAHELNQPLTAILLNAHAATQMLATSAVPGPDIGQIFGEIAVDARRAGEVIHRIRSLLKKGEFEFAPLDVGEVLRDVLVLVRADAVMRKATIGTEIEPALPRVRGDRVQLQQVLLNLILNGLEAMEGTPAGERRLVIRVKSKGAQVLVAVEDTGSGIPQDDMPRIFAPFFTSKPDGFGMGLAISRTIVEAHGGRIWAENRPARGATLWFSLPVSPAPGR
jgi:C4-dicarboxylate-specific signal transduction histidine kinase